MVRAYPYPYPIECDIGFIYEFTVTRSGKFSSHRPAHHQRHGAGGRNCWTADTSGIADADGLDERLAFTYQWLADNAAIAGATRPAPTPCLTPSEGKAITVQVSFTDDGGQ